MNAKSSTGDSINNIWLYWENKEDSVMPSYIELCHETIYKSNKDAQIHLVTPDNIFSYLPDFNKDIKIVVNNTNESSIALKTDYIRVLLLEKYGGLWLDSDVIVCKNLGEQVLNILKVKEFVCIKKIRGHVSNGFMASVPHGKVISEYRKKIEEDLDQHNTFRWTQIGSDLLTPIADKYKDTVHFIDEVRIHPVSFDQSGIFFQNTLVKSISEVVTDDTLTVMLYNSLFDNILSNYATFRYWSKEKILNEDILISAIFRSILKEEDARAPFHLEIPDDYYSDIGLIFPTIDRIDCPSEFLESIHRFFPGISVYIAVQGDHVREQYEKLISGPNVHIFFVPYDYGISASRNFLVRKVKEQYIFLCDDDFIFTERTNLKAAYQILKSNPEIKIVGGMFLNYYYDENNIYQRNVFTSFCNIILKSNANTNTSPVFVPVEYLHIKKHYIDAETYYLYCDSVNNIALIDKSIFYDHDLWWDEQFKIMGQHEDFYLRVKELENIKVVYTNALFSEHHRKTNPVFQKMRSRTEAQLNMLKKWNFSNLIITGKRIDRNFRGEYSRIPFISIDAITERNDQTGELRHQMKRENELKYRNDRINQLRSEVQSIYSSKSWKFSRPFRLIYGFFKR